MESWEQKCDLCRVKGNSADKVVRVLLKREVGKRPKGDVESRGLWFFAYKKVKVTACKGNSIACVYADGGESAERETVVLRERKIVKLSRVKGGGETRALLCPIMTLSRPDCFHCFVENV